MGVQRRIGLKGMSMFSDAMYAHGITCINCHDPHKLTNRADKSEGNSGCMKCHSFGSPIGPHQQSLEAHTHHKGDSKALYVLSAICQRRDDIRRNLL